MVVSMGRGVGDGKIVDGGAISSVVISDMVPSRKDDVGDGEMTSSVVVSDAITYDIVALRRKDIGDNSEVTCGVVVSLREGRGDGRFIIESDVNLALMWTISSRLYSTQRPRNAQENWKANHI